MKTSELKKVFEDKINSIQHQDFIFDQVKNMGSEEARDYMVKFMTSDAFVSLQMDMAKMIISKSPEIAVSGLSKLIMSMVCDQFQGDQDDDRDEFGFQI